MDDLAVADTGTMGYYLALDSPCDNKQLAANPLPIQMPNGEIFVSTHTALLSQQDLPIQARKSHLFPGINKALLSIGILCNRECQSTFDDNSVLILNKRSRKVIMKGTRDTCSNLYILNLIQRNNLLTEFITTYGYFAGSAY